ncbi:MAG TPA: 3-isopropylmalate dehydratase [Deltaproteobacteria bacterium]|jgi:3-isopropylmalate dehydratase small subunit|nr:3-isopropylmalate dehydratase [Deltaproteobacteria bacterium]HQI01926.1 3-isopropylmalate dehydratase [Deltaproteobacteria bacterium]
MDPFKGDVWKFGDNVDTDVIVPGQYLDAPITEIFPHVFESINPAFAKEVKKGDIIVAGKNFGCGSSRENAPSALKEMGIGCIVAESFARIFFRNAVAIGLPVISCGDVSSRFQDHDHASVNLSKALIENTTRKTVTAANPLSEEMLRIIEKGGILNLLKEAKE